MIETIKSAAAETNDKKFRAQMSTLANAIDSATHASAGLAAQDVMGNLPSEFVDRLTTNPPGSARELSRLIDSFPLTPQQAETVQTATGALAKYYSVPEILRSQLFRPTGIGMLVGAAIGGLIAAFPLIYSAFTSLYAAGRLSTGDGGGDELSLKSLMLIVAVGLAVLVVIVDRSTDEMTWPLAITMAILGTIWVWVAGVIVAECVGRTNWSPLSGMTLVAVTLLVFIASHGMTKPATVLSSMMMGAAICLAVSQASDMMLDLKSGYLVGAIPRRQIYAQFLGAWLGPCIVVYLMLLLHNAYEIGSSRLPAPQATARRKSSKESWTTTCRFTAMLPGLGWVCCCRSADWAASA